MKAEFINLLKRGLNGAGPNQLHVLLSNVGTHLACRKETVLCLFAGEIFVLYEIPVFVHRLKSEFLIKPGCAEISEQVDAVAGTFVFRDYVLHQLCSKPLLSEPLIRHDGTDLDIVFPDTVLQKLHPICRYIRDDFAVLYEGIGDVIALKISVRNPSFEIKSEGLLRQCIQHMPFCIVPHII